jgi:ferrous iron transport protein A
MTPIRNSLGAEPSMTTLADLAPGRSGIIVGFRESGPVVHRLMQLGVIEGQPLTVVRTAPMGDPIEIEILGYALSLRRSEARVVLVSEVA